MTSIIGNIVENITGNINGNISSSGNVCIINRNNDITITGNTTVSNNLTQVSNNSNINGNITGNSLLIKGKVDISGNIIGNVMGDISNNIINVTGSVYAGITNNTFNNFALIGNMDISGNENLSGDLNIGSNKFIVSGLNGNTIINGTLGVSGATNIANTLGVTGATNIANTLSVTGATNITNNLNVSGNTTLTGSVINVGTTNSIINIGSTGSTVNILGTTNTIQTTNLQVTDNIITLNKNGAIASASGSGIEFEENNVITGYIKVSSDRNNYNVKMPNNNKIYTLTLADSSGNVNITGNNTITGNSNITGNNTITGNNNITGNLSVTGTSTLTGNVGIGTSSSSYSLTVKDNIQVTNTTYDVMGLFSGSYGNFVHIGSWNAAGNFSKNIVMQNYGGYVGIGTTNPIQKLEVNGNICARTAGHAYVFLNPGWDNSPGYVSYHKIDGTRVGYVGWQDPTNYLSLACENGFSGYKVQQNLLVGSNVGIGTNSPYSKTEIIYGGSSYGGNEFSYHGLFIATGKNYDDTSLYMGVDNGSKYGYINATRQGISSQPIVFNRQTCIDGNGSIGIGTLGPVYKLHVTGDLYAQGWLRCHEGVYSQTHGAHLYRNDEYYGTWRIWGNKQNGWNGINFPDSKVNLMMGLDTGNRECGFHFNDIGWALRIDNNRNMYSSNGIYGSYIKSYGDLDSDGDIHCRYLYSSYLGSYGNINVWGNANISGGITVASTSTFNSYVEMNGNRYVDMLGGIGEFSFLSSRSWHGWSNGSVSIGDVNGGNYNWNSAGGGVDGYYSDLYFVRFNFQSRYRNLSLKALNAVLCPELLLLSDRRIKTNIVDIDDNKALSILRKIQPKTYDYVDKIKKGPINVIGFIAQEIEEIIPHAVTVTKDYIPNFYTLCNISKTDVSNIIMVTTKIDLSWNPLYDISGNPFIDASGNAHSDASGNDFFNVKLYDLSNNEIKCKTTSIIDKRNFLIDISGVNISIDTSETTTLDVSGNPFNPNNIFFLYGQEVNDFHTLDKNAIFTIVTAAVQDIDRKQQEDAIKISTLENKNTELTNKNTELTNKYAELEAQVKLLQDQNSLMQNDLNAIKKLLNLS